MAPTPPPDMPGLRQLSRLLRSNLKFRHLQLMVSISERLHIGRVAEHLSLSQPRPQWTSGHYGLYTKLFDHTHQCLEIHWLDEVSVKAR